MPMPNERSKAPSMKDVAKLAGVSQTTVSFVLNEVTTSNISEPTKRRVWSAIEELGYRPNATARQLRANRTHTIGFLSDVVATTPFAGQVIQGAQEAAWNHGYLLLVINTGGNQKVKQAAAEMLLERRVDGFLYATMYHRAVTPPPQVSEVPTVLLDCFVADRSLPSIVPDEVQGGYDATQALVERGHRRIGYLADQKPVAANVGRLQGLKEALAAADIAFDPALVCAAPSDQAGGYQSTRQLMTSPAPPTAIFCYNDRKAMGAYRALAELGISVPGDVAVIGFDNQELIAPHLVPALTTVELPHLAMGQWAFRHLLELIEEPAMHANRPPIQQLCACPLIRRSSI